MCNLYSITTNQAAIIALFRVMNRYVGNLPPMPAVFPDYPSPVVRNAGTEREMVLIKMTDGVEAPPAPAEWKDYHMVAEEGHTVVGTVKVLEGVESPQLGNRRDAPVGPAIDTFPAARAGGARRHLQGKQAVLLEQGAHVRLQGARRARPSNAALGR